MRAVLRRVAQVLCLVSAAACMTAFVRNFYHNVPQWSDGLWLLSLLSWLAAVVLQPSPERAPRILRVADFWPMALLLPVFAACWLPFYDNWRWAYTGDSFGIYGSGWWFGSKGPQQSLLSVHGIDNYYTYLWECSYNWLMYCFSPTLYWHRVGQLVMACLALTAIYAFYCATLGRLWALFIVLGTATNYVWIWISYISYLRTDSFVFYYLTLIWGLLLWRVPGNLTLWALCGLTGGLSLFYTPVTWGAVAAVALVCGLRALSRKQLIGPIVYAVSFLLAATPILTELPWMMQMLRLQSVPEGAPLAAPDLRYLWSIFRAIILSPFDSTIYILGVQGAFHRWPLGHLYLGGLALALTGVVPGIRRRLRVPVVASVLLALYLSDATLFSVTNKGYGAPSHKRFYNLIPIQVLFALLPLYVAAAWCATRPRLRALCVLLAVASLATSAVLGLQLIVTPRPSQYGYNIFDGVIELRQRFADRDKVLFTDRRAQDLAPGGAFDEVYDVRHRLTVATEVGAPLLDDLCGQRTLFCYELNAVVEPLAAPLIERDPRWQPVQLLNAREMRCYDCIR